MPFSCTKKMVMTGMHVVNFCNRGTWNIYNTMITVKLLMYTYTHALAVLYILAFQVLSPHLSPNLVWSWFAFYLRCLAEMNKIRTALSTMWGLPCGHLQNILVKWNTRKEQSLKLFTGQNQTLQCLLTLPNSVLGVVCRESKTFSWIQWMDLSSRGINPGTNLLEGPLFGRTP